MTTLLSSLPADVADVVTRWNPDAVTESETAGTPGCGVFVAGPRRAGKSTLMDELRALDETVSFVEDPVDAGVVLMVLDAAAPLGREELSVLDVVAPPACAVVFALTKTDVHRDWRAVRDRNHALLAGHSARFADSRIHPVSVRKSEGSRVEELLAALVAAEGKRPRVGPPTAETVLERTKRMIVATARTIRDTEPGADLRAERARVRARRDGHRTERVAQLRGRVQLAKVELMHDVAFRVRTVGTTIRAELDRADRKALAAYPDRLSELIGEMNSAVDAALTARVEDLRALAGIAMPGGSAPTPDREPVVPEGPEPRHRGLEDRMTILIGASAGLGLGRLVVSPLSMVPALDIATIPVTLVLGAVAAWWLTRARGHLADRAHLRQWATESLVHVRSQWEQSVLGRLLAADAQVSDAIIVESRGRMQVADERVAQIDAELRHLSARRSSQLAACERDLATLDRGLQELRRVREPGNRKAISDV
ncbi:MAG: hypothetical protein WAW17_22540 [Rhodococcus sp. (in: high G+C Gram-positive bacteria)]|uniref:hypothetical protein n=1 Tax=Rhodococcus sp. TaxID=1831 RepID=UPI003BAF09B1